MLALDGVAAVDDAFLGLLAETQQHALRVLSVEGCYQLSDYGLASLARRCSLRLVFLFEVARTWCSLAWLCMCMQSSRHETIARGRVRRASARSCRKLEELDISNTSDRVSDGSLLAVAQLPALRSLRACNLRMVCQAKSIDLANTDRWPG